jgi:hypothetical protein
MVYKKYIKRGNKKFGPYYFKSIRDKNGKVRTLYLGNKPGSDEKCRETPFKFNLNSLFVFLFIFLIFGFIILVTKEYLGFSILDLNLQTYSPGDILDGETTIVLESGEFLPEETVIEALLSDQTSSSTLQTLIDQSNLSLAVNEGDYFVKDINLSGNGSGYSILSDVRFSINLSDFGLNVPTEEGTYVLSLSLKYLDTILVQTNKSIVVENLTKRTLTINNKPGFLAIEKQILFKNKRYNLDLSGYVYDIDNDFLTLTADYVENITVNVDGNLLSLDPDKNFIGKRVLKVTVSDGKDSSAFDINLEVIGFETPKVSLKNLTSKEKLFKLNEKIKSKKIRVKALELKMRNTIWI